MLVISLNSRKLKLPLRPPLDNNKLKNKFKKKEVSSLKLR